MRNWTLIIVLAIFSSCNESIDVERDEFECLDNTEFRQLIKETKKIEIDDIDTLKTKVIMGAGRLLLNGKTKHMFAGSFAYNDEKFAPIIKYYKKENWGLIKVIPKQFKEDANHDDIENVWNLRFNEEIPIKMDLKFGAGIGELNIGMLNMYAGILKLGAGKVDINLNNSNSIKNLIVKMGVGDVTINLSDFNRESCNIDIDGGIGKFTLILPEDKNSDIYVDRGIAKISADEFDKQSDHYYNHINKSEETIKVKINAGLGLIELLKSKKKIDSDKNDKAVEETEL
jgi:N-terminal domain of toast_rack, DUF2154